MAPSWTRPSRQACGALEDTVTPETITAALAAATAPGGEMVATPAPGTALWWTTGSPRVQATRLVTMGLPDDSRFAAMLDEAGAAGKEGVLF